MSLAAFLVAHRHEGIVLVRIEAAEGSTPREAGACMAVSRGAIAGTIGGGQLEFHCIDLARHMLGEGAGDGSSTFRSARRWASAVGGGFASRCAIPERPRSPCPPPARRRKPQRGHSS